MPHDLKPTDKKPLFPAKNMSFTTRMIQQQYNNSSRPFTPSFTPLRPPSPYNTDILIYLVHGIPPHNSPEIATLLIGQRLKIADAINEIRDLCPSKIDTLQTLYAYGLRGDDLRDIKTAPGETFGLDHKLALKYLIKDRDRPITIPEALKYVNELTELELLKVYKFNTYPKPRRISYS